jgi:DNA-binding transcriptional MocR family regulator
MSDVATKWGQAVAERGFAQIPNYLLLLNQFLGDEARLKPAELLLLIQLVGNWWHKDKLPFPSIRSLAQRCGVSERQVQRALLRLEKLGFVKRVSRRTHGIIQSNSYDLTPAATILNQVAAAYPNAFPRKVGSTRKLTTADRSLLAAIKLPPPVPPPSENDDKPEGEDLKQA